jgi:hypothetical protein
MTLIGAWIEQDHAFLWADTESYGANGTAVEGQPAGHILKLVHNRRAGVAAALAGTVAGCRRLKNAVDFVDSFDEFIDGISNYLRAERQHLIKDLDPALPAWVVIAAGWSRRFGRMVGVTWDSRTDFAAEQLMRGRAHPHVDSFYTLDPSDPAEVVSLAQAQMREVQRAVPMAGQGTLTVATIRRDDVTVALVDIPSGRPLRAFPEKNLADGVLSMRASAGDGPRCPSRDSQREPAAEPRSSAAGTSP